MGNKTKGEPRYEPNPSSNGGRTRQFDLESASWRKARAIFWGSLSPEDIGRVVARICDSGKGLVLGRTTDGGALSITILDGEHRVREYISSDEDFGLFAQWVLDNI